MLMRLWGEGPTCAAMLQVSEIGMCRGPMLHCCSISCTLVLGITWPGVWAGRHWRWRR